MSSLAQSTVQPTRILNVSEVEFTEDTNSAKFPKHLIDSLVEKWVNLFNFLLKKNKDVRLINAHLDTARFTNCHGVKFNATHFSYNRIKKEFELHVSPMYNQDILCFRSDKNRPGMFIRCKSSKLRNLFVKFFELINKIRFCSSCGSCVMSKSYYADLDMCEACLFEEISASQKSETHTCSICQEDGKRMYKTNCGHYFHRKCLAKINPMPYPRCPLCRKALDTDDEYMDDEANHDDFDEDNDEIENSGSDEATVFRN